MYPMRGKRLFAALLSLLVCAPLHANAGFDRTAAATPLQGEGSNDVNDEAAGRELELFRAAEISLWRALAIAKRLRAGSRVADISFDGASGSPVYRVKTLQGDRVWEDTIDAKTGQIVGNATTSFLNELEREERSNLIALKTVRQELADAVLVAEKSAPGRAMEAVW